MRLGGRIFEKADDPDSWVELLRRRGYRAAYCPVGPKADDDTVRAYAGAAAAADIVIAEVGAWSNPLAEDPKERLKALEKCRSRLLLAERIGARCCVNISGSRGTQWDGPHPANLTEETFEKIVEATRSIIDAVQPTRTYFALETMPWMYPDSTDSYLRLVKAIDRPAFGVHFDPVNLVCSPQRYYAIGELIREFCAKLGPHIRSCHAKDIKLGGRLTVHLDEVRPGLGELDYRAFLGEVSKLDPDMSRLIEHLPDAEEFAKAADHIRQVAADVGVDL